MTHTVSLFDPITLRGLTAPHRLWVAPMCQYSAVDGVPNDWHRVHLGSFVIGRAGLVITEATAVSPEGRISLGCTGLWNDAQGAGWAPITAFASSQGVPLVVQLAHAGRKAATRIPFHEGPDSLVGEADNWNTVAPSALAFGDLQPPHEMTVADIEKVVNDFSAAATRAVAAGFSGVEIHAAHGYLLHEFLSPLSNHRKDNYGGDFTHRVKMVCDVIDAVRAVIPDTMPLLVRLSATDWVVGGWDVEQSIELSTLMEQRGVDFIDVSSGGLDPSQKIPLGPGYQQPFAAAIREHVTLPVGTVGMITTSAQAQEALDNGVADVVLMAKQFLREPSFALRAAQELGADLAWPPQYERAKPRP